MEKKVLDFIEEFHILDNVSRVVLAVSGGADSIALAHLMIRAYPRISFCVAHVNHGLRSEADFEENFVRCFADRLGAEFFCHRVDIAALAKERKQGIEETGREERYRFFRSLNADRILTAHHKDDQAETVLLHLLRGCGIKGLAGIEPLRGDIGRPLLCVTKEEILSYCAEQGLSFQNDPSNEDTVYTRNMVRKELIPMLREINPNVTEALWRLSQNAFSDNRYMEKIASGYYDKYLYRKEGRYHLPVTGLMEEEPAIARRLIRMAAEDCGVIADHDRTEAILKLSSGRMMPLTKDIAVYRDYGEYVFGPRRDAVLSVDAVSLPLCGKTEFGDFVITVDAAEGSPRGNVDCLGVFDADVLGAFSEIRTRRNGDYVILPNGKHKKLSDYFIDEKIPSHHRDEILLLATGNRILWVVGHRFFAPKGERNRIVKISVKS